jgi:hypothetical protein
LYFVNQKVLRVKGIINGEEKMTARFNTVEDVKKEFRMQAQGADQLERHAGFRYSDIDKHAPIIEQLLKTDYNKISGFSFSEICEAISHVQTQFGTRAYLNDFRANGNSISESLYSGLDLTNMEDNYYSLCCEAFEGTTAQQAPYPVPSISFVTYRYEKSVLPYLCHLYDLKGNRGLIYFQKVKATNTFGNIKAGDVLGDARNNVAQNHHFVDTRIIGEAAGTLTNGSVNFTSNALKYKPQPGTLEVLIDGHTGYFKDFQPEMAKDGVAILTPVAENLGYATFDYATRVLTVVLATAPTADGLNVKVTYNREIEEKEAGVAGATNRIAEFTMDVEALQVETENVSVKTQSNIYQEQLSRAIFGLDWNTELDRAMATIYNKELANKVITEIRDEIPAANIAQHDITATLNATGNGDNKLFNTQFLEVVMGILQNKVTITSGTPVAKFAAYVINVGLLPIFNALPKYKAASNTFENQMGGMYVAGTFDGTPVIVSYDALVPEGEIIALYKNKSQDFLTPYVLGTFMEPVIRRVFDQDNLAIQKTQLMSTIGGKNVAPTLTAKLNVTKVKELLGLA